MSESAFQAAIRRLTAVYGERYAPSEDALPEWRTALSVLSDSQLQVAVANTIAKRRARAWPTPGEVRSKAPDPEVSSEPFEPYELVYCDDCRREHRIDRAQSPAIRAYRLAAACCSPLCSLCTGCGLVRASEHQLAAALSESGIRLAPCPCTQPGSRHRADLLARLAETRSAVQANAGNVVDACRALGIAGPWAEAVR